MLPTEVKRHLFDVEEYHRMIETGIVREGARIELIEGELVEMATIGSRHLACVNRLIPNPVEDFRLGRVRRSWFVGRRSRTCTTDDRRSERLTTDKQERMRTIHPDSVSLGFWCASLERTTS